MSQSFLFTDIIAEPRFFFIEKRWNIPLDLSKDSKVCQSCAHNVASVLLEQKMTDSEADIPGKYLKHSLYVLLEKRS